MPRTQQLALATGVLWAAIANAAGIRAHEDVPVTTPAARRLQTTTLSVATAEFDEVWRWDGWTTLDEELYDGAIDLDGNVVLVGTQGFAAAEYVLDDTFEDAYSGDFAAVKLEGASGEVLWTWTASSLGSESDECITVDTDGNNDIIMGGRTEGYWSSSNPDTVAHLAVVKLDGTTGDEIWRYQEHPPDSYTSLGEYFWYGSGSVMGVAVDGDDNCFLVGQVYGSLVYGEGDPGDADFFVIKLDGTDGSEIWTVQGGESTSFDVLRHVKVDSAGDLIAVGMGGDEGAINTVVVKFSGTDGTILWEYSPVTSFTHDVAHSVDVDAQDDVYFAGAYDALNLQGHSAETPVVLKLNGATGDVVWTYEGEAESGAGFLSVAVDPTTGWVVGAGWTEGTWLTGAAHGGLDFAAVVLDGVTGDELGRYQDGTTDDDRLSFVGFNSVGVLFMAGLWTDATQDEFVAIKFASLTGDSSGPLAEWEIGAIVGGGVFLLFLLGLCLFCFRRKRLRVQQGAAKAGSPPVDIFGSPRVHGEVLQPLPPVKGSLTAASGMGEVAPPPPPAPETPLPPPAEQPLQAPPTYNSPPRPPPEVASSENEEPPPPPSYEEMTRPEPAAAPAETPLERLANRVARVPTQKSFEQNYRDVSVSHYPPYAPSTTDR